MSSLSADVLPFVIVIATAIPFVVRSRSSWVGAWSPTQGWYANSFVYTMPIVAILGGVRAIWFSGSGFAGLVSSSPRARASVEFRELVASLRGQLLAAALVAVVMSGITLGQRPAGRVNLMAFVVILATLAASGALGYAVTRAIPHVATPIVVGVAVLIVPYLGVIEATGGWLNVLPMYQSPNSVRPITGLVLFLQVSFYFALAVSSILIVVHYRVARLLSVIVLVIVAGLLLRIPLDRTTAQDAGLAAISCDGAAVRICVPVVHANQVARLMSDLRPMEPLIAQGHPDGVTLSESSATADSLPRGGASIIFDFMAGDNPDASHYDRNRTLADLSGAILDLPLQCPAVVDGGQRLPNLTLKGEIARWYVTKLKIDLQSIPTYAQPVPPDATSNGLAAHLLAIPDTQVFSWLTSSPVRDALRTCSITATTAP